MFGLYYFFYCLQILIIIPGFLSFITRCLGFQTGSNMVISIIIALLIVINIVLTMIVSNQDKKIRLLIQEISILKNKMDDDRNE